jgi:glucosamine--fructose-6-phosphate aminotransferase (isomerizing)
VSIVEPGFPVLCFAAADAAEARLVEVADQVAGKGAAVFVTSALVRAAQPLEHVRTAHPLTDPVALIVSFYAMVEQVAVARGIDPDRPRHLNKVTETV